MYRTLSGMGRFDLMYGMCLYNVLKTSQTPVIVFVQNTDLYLSIYLYLIVFSYISTLHSKITVAK